MLCFMASSTNWIAACSQFRTLPPGWLRALGGLIVSPVFRQLHWLPGRQRVVFKVATLVYQSLSGHAPGYRRLSIGHRRPYTCQTNAFCWHSNACCQPDIQQFRRQDLRNCGTAFRQTWDNRDCRTASSGGHLDSYETAAQCELF